MKDDQKYNHAYSNAFEVKSVSEKEASEDEILYALQDLVKHLQHNRTEISSKRGKPFDSVLN